MKIKHILSILLLTGCAWAQGQFSGGGGTGAKINGSPTINNCAKFDSTTSITDAGGPCGTGTGTVTTTGSPASPNLAAFSGATSITNATAHNVAVPLACSAASASGTAYTCTTSQPFVPADKDAINFVADVANTGAATLNVNSSSAAPIKKQGGGTALVANDLLAGQHTIFIFDGTNWQMQGQGGNGVGGISSGTQGFSYVNTNNSTGNATSPFPGVDASQFVGADACAKVAAASVANPTQTLFNGTLTGNQVCSVANAQAMLASQTAGSLNWGPGTLFVPVSLSGPSSASPSAPIVSITEASTTVTLVYTTTSGFNPAVCSGTCTNNILVAGSSVAGYNHTWTAATVNTGTQTITFAAGAGIATCSSSCGTIRVFNTPQLGTIVKPTAVSLHGSGTGANPGAATTTIAACRGLNSPQAGCTAPATRHWTITSTQTCQSNTATPGCQNTGYDGTNNRLYLQVNVSGGGMDLVGKEPARTEAFSVANTNISESSTTVTVLSTLNPGTGTNNVEIQNSSVAGYNGIWSVTSSSGTQYQFTTGAGLATCSSSCGTTQFTLNSSNNLAGTVCQRSQLASGQTDASCPANPSDTTVYLTVPSGVTGITTGAGTVVAPVTASGGGCSVEPTFVVIAGVAWIQNPGKACTSAPAIANAGSAAITASVMTSCASNCGTIHGEIPLIEDGPGVSGNSFAQETDHVVVDCGGVPDCVPYRSLYVNEMSGVHDADLMGSPERQADVHSFTAGNANSFARVRLNTGTVATCTVGTEAAFFGDNGPHGITDWTSDMSSCSPLVIAGGLRVNSGYLFSAFGGHNEYALFGALLGQDGPCNGCAFYSWAGSPQAATANGVTDGPYQNQQQAAIKVLANWQNNAVATNATTTDYGFFTTKKFSTAAAALGISDDVLSYYINDQTSSAYTFDGGAGQQTAFLATCSTCIDIAYGFESNRYFDFNANLQLTFNQTANAVDYWETKNAATANPATVTLSAKGTDTNINAEIDAKGTGVVKLGANTSVTSAGALSLGSGPPSCGTGVTGAFCLGEASTAFTVATGMDACRADSTAHQFKCTLNNGAEFISLMNFSTITNALITSMSEDKLTGAAAAQTITETGATFAITRAGVETANLRAPWVFQNTNSTNNNTSIGLGVSTPGTSTGQTTLNVNGTTTQGNLIEAGTGGTWTAGVLSGQTKQFQVSPTGLITLGAATGCTPGTAGGHCDNEGTAPTGAATVDAVYADSTQHAESVNNNNTGNMPISRVTCVNVTPVTVNANVSTDQNLMTCTLPANLLNVVGRVLHVHAAGIYSTAATSTATLTSEAKLCTISGCGSGTVIDLTDITTVALASITVTNNNWNLDFYSVTQTAGATAAFESHGQFIIDLGALTTAADSVFADTNTATVGTIDSTGQLFLQIAWAFSAASASNSVSQRQGVVEVLN